MLVYGDHGERANPAERLAAIRDQLDPAAIRQGIQRHLTLVGALVEAGRVLQGVADADFAACAHDRPIPQAAALATFLQALAGAVCKSWDQGFAGNLAIPTPPPLPNLPEIELRLPEGYAFYALYPEAYAEAARRLILAGSPRVIGIRSIGTSLAAIVAAALDAPVPVTVRPFGDPFARQIAVAPDLARGLLAGDPHFIIVDEGPGLSASSFGAVVDWLQERGVPLSRIAVLPSHGGSPGSEASEPIRTRWPLLQGQVADFGPTLPGLLHGWTEQALGKLDGPLIEISGGEWRRHLSLPHWPAVNPMWERRKFLARAKGEPLLFRFAGLGDHGTAKLALARTLHAAGLTPEPRALVHGFLCERWHEDATPLSPNDEPPIAHIAHYIGTRALLAPAPADSGASLATLLTMARRNIGLALGEEAAAALDRWEPRLPALAAMVQRTVTDNRLLPHEWLRLPDGRLLKSDALDHHAAHDLIGCQDLAWDVAGAIVEFDLDPPSADRLLSATEHAAGRSIAPGLLAFYRVAYAAFRLGQSAISLSMVADPAERDRLAATRDRFAGACTLNIDSAAKLD